MTIGQLEELINNKPDHLSWSEWREINIEVINYPSIEFTSYTPYELSSGFVPDEDEPCFLILQEPIDDTDLLDDNNEELADFDPELN